MTAHRRFLGLRPDLWAGALVVALAVVSGAPGAAAQEPVRITATAAVLMDARSGEVLYSRNPHLRWPPASTTKILTALVALQSRPLDAPIRISPEVARFREGSVVGLPEGAEIPLRDLLYGLLLQSGNAEAERLGARDTHFTSPHGLYAPDHYSTAYDLALITRAALRIPAFREIVRTRRWVFDPPGGPARVLWNHNRLLSRYPGADGVKTGYVHQSGQTLVASATRDGWQLIAVLLHSTDLWGDAARLLDYGFSRFRPLELAHAGEELAALELPGARRLVVGVVPHALFGVVPRGEVPVRRVVVSSRLPVPLRRGTPIGQVRFYVGGRLLAASPLVAAGDVGPSSALPGVVEWIGRMLGRLLGAAVF